MPRPPAPAGEPDTWNLARADVLVQIEEGLTEEYVLDESLQDVRLGFHTGRVVYLNQVPHHEVPPRDR